MRVEILGSGHRDIVLGSRFYDGAEALSVFGLLQNRIGSCGDLANT